MEHVELEQVLRAISKVLFYSGLVQLVDRFTFLAVDAANPILRNTDFVTQTKIWRLLELSFAAAEPTFHVRANRIDELGSWVTLIEVRKIGWNGSIASGIHAL